MTTLTYSHTLVAGTPEDVNDVQDMFDDVKTWANGNIDDDNLSSGHLDKVGVTSDTVVRRGKAIIATEESRSNASAAVLTTPDRVSSVVVSTDGLLCISYRALVKESVYNAGSFVIVIGGTTVFGPSYADSGATFGRLITQTGVGGKDAVSANIAGVYRRLFTASTDLTVAYSGLVVDEGHHAGDAAFGPGGAGSSFIVNPLFIEVAAGTYNIEVQFAASSGSVTAKDRRLRVWTMGF